MKQNRVLVAVSSDEHVGSTTGLMPKNGIVLPDGQTLLPSPFQKEVAEHWEKTWRIVRKEANKFGGKLYVIKGGDGIDGKHHDTYQMWSRPNDHIDTHVQLYKPIRSISDKMFQITGTGAHNGDDGDADETIARELGCDKLYGRWASSIIRPEICGVQFHCVHKGPSVGNREWNIENQLRLYVKSMIMKSLADGETPPLAFISAHFHRKLEVLVEYHGHECWGFITPSWQLRTEYGMEVSGNEHMVDIGALLIWLENGKVVDHRFELMRFDEVPTVKV